MFSFALSDDIADKWELESNFSHMADMHFILNTVSRNRPGISYLVIIITCD